VRRPCCWAPLQARLVRIVASHQLDLPLEEVEQRLGELVLLVPDLGACRAPARRRRGRNTCACTRMRVPAGRPAAAGRAGPSALPAAPARPAGDKLHRMTPQLLVDLLRRPELLPLRLIALRDVLPRANVSRIAAQRPQLLLQEPAEVAGAARELQRLLGVPPEAVDG
jgi:hypothetical protein